MLSILIYFFLLFPIVLSDVVLGSTIVLGAPQTRIVIELLILAFALFAMVHALIIRAGRWREIVLEFSNLDRDAELKSQLAYRLFLGGAAAMLALSLTIAALVGVMK